MTKEKKQISLITETMIEAVEHMKGLLKVGNKGSFYPLFTNFIETFQIIIPYVHEKNDHEAFELVSKIEKDLTMSLEEIEKDNLQKAVSIYQFSLEPNCRKLHNHFKIEKISEKCVIGLYDPKRNPVVTYRDERLEALFDEAKKQNCELYMFESKDIDIEKGEINARSSLEDESKKTIGVPDVIYNLWPNQNYSQDEEERWLRKQAPFLSFPINDKLILPQKMIKETNLGHLFIPFVGVTDLDKVYKFLYKHKKGVLKKTAAARGENIFFIEQKSSNRFVVEVDKRPIIMNKEGFGNWIEEYIIPEKYILQEYKEFRTKKGEPYDIRAHVQKNGKGNWVITKIYPRIGSRKTILSNISLGGRTLDLKDFLKEEFSQHKTEKYYKELTNLSLEIAREIDRIYNYSIDELGLDLAIDHNERIWMHEANAKPQTTYHEKERAVNTIAYLKYLAEKRLFLTNKMQEMTGFDNQFKYYKGINMEVKDLDKSKVTIGLLYDAGSTKEKFLEACAIVSAYTGVNFYAFQAMDIDYENKVIKGKVFENFAWKDKVVRYPDVIYDRLRMKNSSVYNLVYTEFSDLRFTHTLELEQLNKLTIYNEMEKIDALKEYIIPHSDVVNEDELIDFIDTYETVILKPIHGSFAVGIIKIEKVGKRYIWTEDTSIEYSLTQIKRIFKEKNIYNRYLIQKFIEFKSKEGRPIDIRVHMIKDKDDSSKWHIAKDYVRISDGGFKINTELFSEGRAFSGATTYVNRYIAQNFEKNSKEIEEKIWKVAQEIAFHFDQLHEGEVAEQALDLGITLDGEIYLVEINANRPGVYGYEYEIARYMIPYAAKLMEVEE